MLVLPQLVLETLEAATSYLALLMTLILFIIMPSVWYSTIGEPVCVLDGFES
jgi:hypothetical protein